MKKLILLIVTLFLIFGVAGLGFSKSNNLIEDFALYLAGGYGQQFNGWGLSLMAGFNGTGIGGGFGLFPAPESLSGEKTGPDEAKWAIFAKWTFVQPTPSVRMYIKGGYGLLAIEDYITVSGQDRTLFNGFWITAGGDLIVLPPFLYIFVDGGFGFILNYEDSITGNIPNSLFTINIGAGVEIK